MGAFTAMKSDDHLKERHIPDYLADVSALAVAVIGRDGQLWEGNRAFMELMPADVPAKAGADVSGVFANPRFEQFAGRRVPRGVSAQIIYEGVLNLGPRAGRAMALNGTVYADDQTLFVVAEHNVTVIEQLNSSLSVLNEKLAEMQGELTRLNRQLAHQEGLAEAALEDRNILLEALTLGEGKDRT